MNIICIDTSTSTIGITAEGPLGIYTSIFTPLKMRHSSLLIEMIENTIKHAGFNITETDMIACPQGPAGFTGLRLSYTTAKAIQLKTKAELYCVPVLKALSFRYGKECVQFLAVSDAKRNCFYIQFFDKMQPLTEVQDIPALKAITLIEKNKPLTICGFGTDAFKYAVEEKINAQFIEAKPEEFSLIMLEYIKSVKPLIKIEEYDGPLYVRKSDAEQ